MARLIAAWSLLLGAVTDAIWPTPQVWETPLDAGVLRLANASMPALALEGCADEWCDRLHGVRRRHVPKRPAVYGHCVCTVSSGHLPGRRRTFPESWKNWCGFLAPATPARW